MFGMIANACRPKASTAAILAGLLISSCAPITAPPEKVDQTPPTVTYEYTTDQELVNVRPRAVEYCSRYQAVPHAIRFSTRPDTGRRIVVFECVDTVPPVATAVPPSPPLTYTYRTDGELLSALQSAHGYCVRNGGRDVVSNIVTNPDGSKTVTFRCSPA